MYVYYSFFRDVLKWVEVLEITLRIHLSRKLI